jgi:hypothetical protein
MDGTRALRRESELKLRGKSILDDPEQEGLGW